MATVNINSNWTYARSSNVVTVTLSTTEVFFKISSAYNGYMEYAKAYIPISNISQYKSITLTYSSYWSQGIHNLFFGVFDDADPESLSGKVASHTFSDSGGTITISDLSSLSGTKYVGFYFYGNSCSPGVDNYGYPRASVTISSLTAVENGYRLTYDANGGSGAPSSVSDITSTTISSKAPTRSGYDFLGWSTSSSAISANYVSGDTISLSSNITLYAVWKKKTYAITYNANGGSGAPMGQTKTHDETLYLSSIKPTKVSTSAGNYIVALNANGGTCAYGSLISSTTISYTFSEWNTDPNGTGVSYNVGASYTANEPLSLYAIYDSSTNITPVTLPMPTRDGYKFMGWAESNTETSGVVDRYTPTGDITLYAIWKSMGFVYICDNTGEFSTYQVLIYDGSGWNQYVPYIYTESGWEIYSE